MTQEDKNLLLKDLCGRLPYRVKCKYYDCCEGDYNEGTICGFERQEYIQIDGVCIHIEEVKPYLFPLRSLTSSEAEAIEHIMGCNFPWNIQYGLLEWTVGGSVESETFELKIEQIERLIEFLNSHHIDYRGLIPMGSAIDATNLNIY